MAIIINGTLPTKIIVEHPSQNFQVDFPSGSLTVSKQNAGTTSSPDYRYIGWLVKDITYNSDVAKLNGILVEDDQYVTINIKEGGGITTGRAAVCINNKLELVTTYGEATSAAAPDTKSVVIASYSTIATPCTSLTKVQAVKNGTTEVVWEKQEQSTTLFSPIVIAAFYGSQQDILVHVANSNNVNVTCYVTFYDANDSIYGSGSFSVSANSAIYNQSISLDSSGEFESGAYITCYFTASGYTRSAATTYTVE